MADTFTRILLDAAKAEVPPPPSRNPKHGGCGFAETSAAFTETWDARDKARRRLRINPREKTAWKTLKTMCAHLRKVIDA